MPFDENTKFAFVDAQFHGIAFRPQMVGGLLQKIPDLDRRGWCQHAGIFPLRGKNALRFALPETDREGSKAGSACCDATELKRYTRSAVMPMAWG